MFKDKFIFYIESDKLFINHRQYNIEKYGTCNDVTQMILFLADNNKSGWITGQIIKLDGGRSCVDIGSGYPNNKIANTDQET